MHTPQHRAAPRVRRYGHTQLEPVKKGLSTCNDIRYINYFWEMQNTHLPIERFYQNDNQKIKNKEEISWHPIIMGSQGREWFEPLTKAISWENNGLSLKVYQEYKYKSVSKHIRNEGFYFTQGISFSMIGSSFSSRVHLYKSIFNDMASTLFSEKIAERLCFLNSIRSRYIMESLNPTIHFHNGDIERLPLLDFYLAEEIYEYCSSTVEKDSCHAA